MGHEFELLAEKEMMWAQMLMQVLRDSDIACAALPVHGAGLVLRSGIQERLKVFVPLEQLQQAKELLPIKGYWNSANLGRVTKASAAALLGKCYLYRSGIETYYGADEKTYYNEAAKEFSDIIDGKYGIYNLTANYADNFDVAHENNVESILEIQFLGDVENNSFNPGLATSGLAFDSRGLMLPGAGVGYEGVAHDWLYESFVNSIF